MDNNQTPFWEVSVLLLGVAKFRKVYHVEGMMWEDVRALVDNNVPVEISKGYEIHE